MNITPCYERGSGSLILSGPANFKELSMSDGGKGSSPRPFSIANDEYSKRWDAIFGRDLKTVVDESESDKIERNNVETQEVKKISR
jgi:hypothetical protein